MTTCQYTIVKLKNGNYVKDWQYSQGIFEVEETNNVFHAKWIPESQFTKFFKPKDAGHTLIEADFVCFEKTLNI